MPGVASSSLVSAWRKMRSEKKKDPYGLRGEYGGGTDAVKSLQEFVKGGSAELAKDPAVRARMNEANSTVLEGARRGAEDYSRTTGEGAGSSGGAAQRTLALTLGSSAGSSAANNILASERDQKLRSLAALADTETTRLGMELSSESELRALDEAKRNRRDQLNRDQMPYKGTALALQLNDFNDKHKGTLYGTNSRSTGSRYDSLARHYGLI